MISGHSMLMAGREQKAAEAAERQTKLTVELRSCDSRIHLLSELEKELEGFSKAAKIVMQESERGTLRGVHGPVGKMIRAADRYALAVETALGAHVGDIIVDTQDNGKDIFALLKRRDGGRVTLQPMDVIRPARLSSEPKGEAGYVGVCSDLVDCDKRYSAVIASLLGRTAVAETLADAIAIARRHGNSFRIVTLDGQILNAGGSMTGGSAAKGTGILSRANELTELKKRRVKLETDYNNASAELDKARNALAGLRYELDMALEDQAEINRSIAANEAEKRTTELAINQLKVLLEALSGDSFSRRKAIERSESERSMIENKLQTVLEKRKRILAEADGIRAEISEITNKRLELEGRRTKADRDAQERNRELLELQKTCSALEGKKNAADMEEKQILDKLWENYELSYSAAQELRQPVENLQKETKGISELRRRISALGTPNIGAIEEYERVSTRYDFLTGQRDDIQKAKTELVGIINDVTSEMQEVFIQQFKLIDENFRQTFLELFGGGKAAILLEDEANPLECGIEIRCSPRARRYRI